MKGIMRIVVIIMMSSWSLPRGRGCDDDDDDDDDDDPVVVPAPLLLPPLP